VIQYGLQLHLVGSFSRVGINPIDFQIAHGFPGGVPLFAELALSTTTAILCFLDNWQVVSDVDEHVAIERVFVASDVVLPDAAQLSGDLLLQFDD